MSRLGKKPVPLGKATASINGRKVSISSGNSTLEYEHRPEVKVTLDDASKALNVTIDPKDESIKQVRAYWGLTRALLANMVKGVTDGYEKKLEVVGVGYTAQLAGQRLDLKVGFANTISVPIPPGLTVTVDKQMIVVKGPDKQAVGEFAAKVRSKRKPEPYNGKGIKYIDEIVRRKQGKAFGS
ncbi:MAG: 50S ribosomal protein L6 [Phycisphaerales bacterium]|nr:50S ribosomal protein L6 [Phycisphaerales bacterium]